MPRKLLNKSKSLKIKKSKSRKIKKTLNGGDPKSCEEYLYKIREIILMYYSGSINKNIAINAIRTYINNYPILKNECKKDIKLYINLIKSMSDGAPIDI